MSLPHFLTKTLRCRKTLRMVAFVCLLPWLPIVPVAADTPVAAPVAAPEQVWHSDLDAALAKAGVDDALIVVDLYADWCGWCKKLEREVFPTPEFRQFADDKVLLRVDVEDGGEGAALQARYEAFSLPTTLLLDADLIQVGKVSGFAPAAPLVASFEAEIAAWERIADRYPQILANGSEELRRSLARELHQRGDGERAAALYAKVLAASSHLEPDAPWLYYLQADAHRLARDYEAARAATQRARELVFDRDLAEKLDLLAYRIAQDEGDCQGAKSTLRAFLDRNPESKMRRQIARKLQALEQGHDGLCA